MFVIRGGSGGHVNIYLKLPDFWHIFFSAIHERRVDGIYKLDL